MLLIISFSIISMLFLINLFYEKKISKILGIVIFISLLLVTLMLLSAAIYGNVNDFTITKYLTVILRSVPMVILASFLIKKKKNWHVKRLIFINVVITVSLTKFLYENKSSLFLGYTLNFGGVNYNELAYICALNIALSYLLIYNLYISPNAKKIQYLFFFTNLALSYAVLFFSGGRGAMMLSIFFFLIFLLNIFIRKQINVKKTSLTFGFIFIFLLSIYFIISNNEPLQEGFLRGFSFLNFSGNSVIKWENTSGRLSIYEDSLRLIVDKPILGYGIGSVFLIHPSAAFSHNLFLDILIDGGVFFLFLCVTLFIIIFVSSIRHLHKFEYYFAFNLFLFSFINLLSGSNYLIEPILFFSITYIVLLKQESVVNIKERRNLY